MAKAIMVQGTMSNVGKSLLTAGLCRVFWQEGLRVAPFKSQNMALNSFITREGLEMGRAQVVQAEACGREPSVRMNPILLKPVTDMGSQLIVLGEPRGNFRAEEYYKMKRSLLPEIMASYESLAAENDVIVLEGAGSPAEINLKAGDFVNMGMAKLAKAPVLLVGDIDRGGVFAQLVGTLVLLEEEERALVKALIVNKFRGDPALLRPGLALLEERAQKPVAGVLPMLDVDIEEEDSLAARLRRSPAGEGLVIAVARLPKLSNFTDFAALEASEGVSVRYASTPAELADADLIILPGTKSTLADLRWLRASGLEAMIKRRAEAGTLVLGICGGYQMLGERVTDSEGAEGGGSERGLGLLPATTEFLPEKRRTRVNGHILPLEGPLAALSGTPLEGYEIHMGATTLAPGAQPFIRLEDGSLDGCRKGMVFGTYLHGFFDSAPCRAALLSALRKSRGLPEAPLAAFDWQEYKRRQYDILADAVRAHLDMPLIRKILEEGV